MKLIACLCISRGLVARVAPLLRVPEGLEVRRNGNINFRGGVPARDQTIYVVVSIFCAIVLASLLGMEVTQQN